MSDMIHREIHASSYGWRRLPDGTEISYTGYSLPIPGPIASREDCDKHNERVGEKNWKRHIYSWREYAKYLLTASGRVFFEQGSEITEVKDDATIAQIHGLAKEDAETAAARDQFAIEQAAALYDGDPRAETMLRTAVEYCSDLDPRIEDGIAFYSVGRNASHDFYMGMRKTEDGEWELLSGADGYEDPFSYRVRESGSWSGGYYGHH